MRVLVFVFLVVTLSGCSQGKQALPGNTEWQKKMNADFKDASKSPLKNKDRKNFEGLEFFPFDSTYLVKAHLKRTPDSKPFKMKTTTDRLPQYVTYGVVTFQLNRKEFHLNIYQDLDLMEDEQYEDFLFLPFLDNTNGDDTYGGGRYVEANIPEGDLIEINFNEAYNPYCAYNEKYSCPIVPRENYLDTEVKAGVKDFKKN